MFWKLGNKCMGQGDTSIIGERKEEKRMNTEIPKVICPVCGRTNEMEKSITAQSNQNIIFECPACGYERRNIQTSKG